MNKQDDQKPGGQQLIRFPFTCRFSFPSVFNPGLVERLRFVFDTSGVGGVGRGAVDACIHVIPMRPKCPLDPERPRSYTQDTP